MSFSYAVAFNQALQLRREIEAAAKSGDVYAQKLHKGYEECNPAVMGMPWPEKKDVADKTA